MKLLLFLQILFASFDKSTDVATFTWSAPTDDVTPSAALRYNFYLREKGSDKIFMTVPADLQTGFVRVGRIQFGRSLSDALIR